MNVFDSSLFGKIQEPESFDELISILSNEESIDFMPVRYWRGQSDIEWAIHSAGYRRLQKDKYKVLKDDDKNLTFYEEQLIEQATHKGYRYHNGRELYDFELLGRLQHHGAATRLVDFSKNALIALYFCIIENINKTGLLFGLHTHYISGYESELQKLPYTEIIKGLVSDTPTTWEPPSISTRIAAQHAQFVYSKVSNDKTGSLIIPKEENAKLFIAISPKMKDKFKPILEGLFDFRIITLFPDLDGFGFANSHNVNRGDMYRW